MRGASLRTRSSIDNNRQRTSSLQIYHQRFLAVAIATSIGILGWWKGGEVFDTHPELVQQKRHAGEIFQISPSISSSFLLTCFGQIETAIQDTEKRLKETEKESTQTDLRREIQQTLNEERRWRN